MACVQLSPFAVLEACGAIGFALRRLFSGEGDLAGGEGWRGCRLLNRGKAWRGKSGNSGFLHGFSFLFGAVSMLLLGYSHVLSQLLAPARRRENRGIL
ncbi:hypothetical protein SBV1_1020026 [Verrucomicrobia bacterium]|nr:hypothetical protein SBV1_1020026 [Verrucomicrobiota bacterium]